MNKVLAIGSAVVADAIRRKVVWVVVVFAALLAFAIPTLPSYGVGVVEGVYKEVVIALMFAAAFVVTLALAATRIPSEVERRTVFNVLSRDVRRWQYLLGTWFGIVVVSGAALVALTAISVAAAAVVYHAALIELFAATFAVWLEMGVISAFAIMMSTRMGSVTSIVGATAFAFIGHSLGSLFAGASGVPRWYVPSLDVFNVIDPVAYGTGYGIGYALGMVGAFLAWSALLMLIATVMFEGRDL
ncbi:MAG: hypothetical protein CVT67_06140 [Actinobacteria bacterium HGW-Actinobacteria-7]|nr:MAG: hypothetical protein CVT67_06140 [Actinobacteria bacterium HGW-Actinobacteria-7]